METPLPSSPAALDNLVDCLGGEHALAIARETIGEKETFASTAGLSRGEVERFLGPDAAPFMTSFMQSMPPGLPATRSQVFDDSAFERMPLYNEFVRPANGFHSLSIRFREPGASYFVVVCRSRTVGDFRRRDAHTLKAHLPTVLEELAHRRSLATALRRNAWLAALIHRLPYAVMLLDARRTVQLTNRRADSLLDSGLLRIGRGGLSTADAHANRDLRVAVAGIAAGKPTGTGPIRVERGGGHTPLEMHVSAFAPSRDEGLIWSTAPQPAIMLVIDDPESDLEPKQRLLRDAIGLTGAEASLAAALLSGQTLQEYAARNGRSMNTVKTHMRAIFMKTGTSRQSELTRKLGMLLMLGG